MDVSELATELRAEQDALDAVVADLPEVKWNIPTPSPGWTVGDQIGHLTYFDGTAALAITDPDGFKASLAEAAAGLADGDRVPWYGRSMGACLVVTQPRHVDDTSLEATGSAARDWMEKAQAFAGTPTDGPKPAAVAP